jgi:hypothetical protein
MENKKTALILASLLVFSASGSAALQGYVVESGPSSVSDLIYTWGSAETSPHYQDAQSYPDVALMLCDTEGDVTNNYYLGLEYLMNNQNTRVNQLVSYGDSNLALADTSVTFNGNTCKRTAIGGMTVSPSVISGTPDTKVAAHPAEAYMLVSSSVDGSNPSFVPANSELAGSYSGSTSYSYDSNEVSLSLSSIAVNSNLGVRTYSPSNSNRGINSDNPLTVGVCNDQAGQNCPSGAVKINSPSFPQTYVFDKLQSNVNDQNVYTRHGVANGKTFSTLNIGADLEVSSLSVSKDPVYYSQTQDISFTVVNTGNVPVTSNFNVEATVSDSDGNVVDTETWSVSEDLTEKGGSQSFNYDWQALEKSGDYQVRVEVDTGDNIVEISEGNNLEFLNFRLKPITLPEIYVNGGKISKTETTFPDAGVPYNFSVKMKNSDNITLSNSTVEIVQRDGMSTFAPTQTTADGNMTDSKSSISFRTDNNGTASITVIPTGNSVLKEEYNISESEQLDYSLRMTGQQRDGTDFKFINNGQLQNYYPMSVADPGDIGGEGTSQLPNLDGYVKMTMNGVYTAFAEFWGSVT